MEGSRAKALAFYLGLASPLVLVAVWLLILAAPISEKQASPSKIYDGQTLNALETGDLVFRRQFGMISEIARKLSPIEKRFSHVGIVLKHLEGTTVIHSVSDDTRGYDGVVSENISTFLSESSDWAFYRVPMTTDQRLALELHADKLLEARIPFDDDFDLSTNGELYCTEMVAKIFNHLFEQPLFEANTLAGKAYLPLDALYLSQGVEEVIP